MTICKREIFNLGRRKYANDWHKKSVILNLLTLNMVLASNLSWGCCLSYVQWGFNFFLLQVSSTILFFNLLFAEQRLCHWESSWVGYDPQQICKVCILSFIAWEIFIEQIPYECEKSRHGYSKVRTAPNVECLQDTVLTQSQQGRAISFSCSYEKCPTNWN